MKFSTTMSAKDLNLFMSVLAEGKRQMVTALLKKVGELEGALTVLSGDCTTEGLACRKYLLTKIEEYSQEIQKLS